MVHCHRGCALFEGKKCVMFLIALQAPTTRTNLVKGKFSVCFFLCVRVCVLFLLNFRFKGTDVGYLQGHIT